MSDNCSSDDGERQLSNLGNPHQNGHSVNDLERAALSDKTGPWADGSALDDDAAVAAAVRWIGERYVMSDAFARILLSQLARQDGVTEAAAARSVLVTAVVEAATPTSLPAP